MALLITSSLGIFRFQTFCQPNHNIAHTAVFTFNPAPHPLYPYFTRSTRWLTCPPTLTVISIQLSLSSWFSINILKSLCHSSICMGFALHHQQFGCRVCFFLTSQHISKPAAATALASTVSLIYTPYPSAHFPPTLIVISFLLSYGPIC